MDDETANKTRTMIRRVVIKNFDDSGQTQTATIESAENIIHDHVEILQPYGFATLPPADGAIGIALSVGGDEGDPVVLPVANPANRMGRLDPGDAALYNAGGDQVILRANGTLEIKMGGAATLEIPDGVTIKTTKLLVDAEMLECTGDIKDKNGTMQAIRDQYNGHGHPDASPPPSPKME